MQRRPTAGFRLTEGSRRCEHWLRGARDRPQGLAIKASCLPPTAIEAQRIEGGVCAEGPPLPPSARPGEQHQCHAY